MYRSSVILQLTKCQKYVSWTNIERKASNCCYFACLQQLFPDHSTNKTCLRQVSILQYQTIPPQFKIRRIFKKSKKLFMENKQNLITQSKSETQIIRSVHSKFNCITVKYNGTWHSIYIILEIHWPQSDRVTE